MSNRISVGIVDDHKLFRRAIRQTLEHYEQFDVSEAANGKELLDQVDSGGTVHDIYLIDLNMPVMNGLETVRWLRQNHPQSYLISFSMNDSEEDTRKMKEAGCCTAVSKTIEPQKLVQLLIRLKKSGLHNADLGS